MYAGTVSGTRAELDRLFRALELDMRGSHVEVRCFCFRLRMEELSEIQVRPSPQPQKRTTARVFFSARHMFVSHESQAGPKFSLYPQPRPAPRLSHRTRACTLTPTLTPSPVPRPAPAFPPTPTMHAPGDA